MNQYTHRTQAERVLTHLKLGNDTADGIRFAIAVTIVPRASIRRAIGTLRRRGHLITIDSHGVYELRGKTYDFKAYDVTTA